MPEQKLKNTKQDAMWDEYCGFLSLSTNEYMDIQRRLLSEQLALYCDCELGRRMLNGKRPASVSEFRSASVLTTYGDYDDILLQHVESALPQKPAAWIETPWKGGNRPVKVIPHTQSMLDNFSRLLVAMLLNLSALTNRRVNLKHPEDITGIAPPALLTGLMPYLLNEGLPVRYTCRCPSINDLSAQQRSAEGIRLGMTRNPGVVLGSSTALAGISSLFWSENAGDSTLPELLKTTFFPNYRFFKAVKKRRQHGCAIRPRDIWQPRGLISMGSDAGHLKKKIEDVWGMRPLELFATAETGGIAMEPAAGDGLCFLPDAGFYEFLPMDELEKSLLDPAHRPKTYLMDELIAGRSYELVFSSFKGGVFSRCRLGEVFRCVSLTDEENGILFPQFFHVGKTPDVIDITDYFSFTESTINDAIRLSNLDILDWFAVKEYDAHRNAGMHLYVEIGSQTVISGAVTPQVLHEHLSIYFRYLDTDYPQLKQLTRCDPMRITILPTGTVRAYIGIAGCALRHMNPSRHEVVDILRMAFGESEEVL